MVRKGTEQQLLYLEPDVLELMGDSIVLRLLSELSSDKKRFSELQGGMSSKTLSSRLKKLEKNELITRRLYAEVPPRSEYSLTEKGREFLSIINGVLDWEYSWRK